MNSIKSVAWVPDKMSMDQIIYKMLLQKAADNGYDVGPVIKVDQDCG
jgi:hypothetical protein